MATLDTINTTLEGIARQLQTNNETQQRELNDVEEALDGVANAITKGIDFVMDFGKVQDQLSYLGLNAKDLLETQKDGVAFLGDALGQLSYMATFSELGYNRSKDDSKNLLNLVMMNEKAGRSNTQLLGYLDTITSQGATGEQQDAIINSLFEIKNNTGLTSEATLAAIEPLAAFQIQLDQLGEGVFTNISTAMGELVKSGNMTASQGAQAGKLIEALLDPKNAQTAAVLGVQDEIDKLLSPTTTAAEAQQLLLKIIEEGSNKASEFYDIYLKNEGDLKQVRAAAAKEAGGKLGHLVLINERIQRTAEERKKAGERTQTTEEQMRANIQQIMQNVTTIAQSGLIQFSEWDKVKESFENISNFSESVLNVLPFLKGMDGEKAAAAEAGVELEQNKNINTPRPWWQQAGLFAADMVNPLSWGKLIDERVPDTTDVVDMAQGNKEVQERTLEVLGDISDSTLKTVNRLDSFFRGIWD